jgi:hypothetical protein
VEELQVRIGALLTMVVAAAGGVGCGANGSVPAPKYSLEGSLSAVMNLGWDEAFIDTTASEVAVRFVRRKGMTEDTTLKVTWAQAGQALNTPATIILAEARPDDPTRQRTIVSRNVLDDPRNVFPELAVGKMIFFDQIKPDARVRGELNMTFVNGIEFANGRTIFGPFTAKVPP